NMHLQHQLDIRNIKAYTAGFLRCMVSSKPVSAEGGHVFFSVAQNGCQMVAAVYEPTELSKTARMLEPGDSIEIGCGVRKGTTKHPKVLNVEYLSVISVAEVFEVVNPLCICRRRLKSAGTNKGFKCEQCGHVERNASKVHVPVKRELVPGL